MSSRRSWTSSRIENMSSARFASESARQAGKASFATETTRSISSADAKSTSPVCSPVAGLKTGPLRPEVPGTIWPPIQWLMRVAGGVERSASWGRVVLMSSSLAGSVSLGLRIAPPDRRPFCAFKQGSSVSQGGSKLVGRPSGRTEARRSHARSRRSEGHERRRAASAERPAGAGRDRARSPRGRHGRDSDAQALRGASGLRCGASPPRQLTAHARTRTRERSRAPETALSPFRRAG